MDSESAVVGVGVGSGAVLVGLLVAQGARTPLIVPKSSSEAPLLIIPEPKMQLAHPDTSSFFSGDSKKNLGKI